MEKATFNYIQSSTWVSNEIKYIYIYIYIYEHVRLSSKQRFKIRQSVNDGDKMIGKGFYIYIKHSSFKRNVLF